MQRAEESELSLTKDCIALHTNIILTLMIVTVTIRSNEVLKYFLVESLDVLQVL